jgi:hypothetical protein
MKELILRLESLESRAILSTNPVPSVVAPPEAGFAPVILPTGVAPHGTTTLSPPAAGQLPQGLPSIVGHAELQAFNAIVGFQANHPTAVLNVADSIGTSTFSVTVTAQDGSNFFQYSVTEQSGLVEMNFVMGDGANAQFVAAVERTTSGDLAGVASAQFTNGALTELTVISSVNGNTTFNIYFYAPPAPALTPSARVVPSNPIPLLAHDLSGFAHSILGEVNTDISAIDTYYAQLGA